MSSHSLPSWRQPRQKRFVRFANAVLRVSIRVTPAWWQIYPGRVGRCGSNCMHDAFFCGNKECQARILTDALPNGVAPKARRTTRLGDLLTLIGFARGGEPGNCLGERVGLEASPET